ncbi:MAG: flagellar filament capping protein FliD [Planctomycetota bacterium]
MSGITTSVGIFSGIDTASLIDQLIAASSRPRVLFQQRAVDLQFQQQSYQTINSSLAALETAAARFRESSSFDAALATSSNEDVLRATASAGAQTGSFQFIVDQLVSTQQMLSRGFADSDTSAVGLSTLTFEPAEARLDRDTALELLNNGAGIERGVFQISIEDPTEGDANAKIDLSRASTVGEVLEAINSSGLDLTATVSDGSIVITPESGSATVTIEDGDDGTAASLGFTLDTPATSVSTSDLYGMFGQLGLNVLNDGRGIEINDIAGDTYDFTVDVAGTSVQVNLGAVWDDVLDPTPEDEFNTTFQEVEGPVSTVDGVITRFNTALADAGFGDVTLAISSDGNGFTVNDTMGRAITIANREDYSAASDLGIAGSFTGTLEGRRVLAGLNTTLASSLNGGAGLSDGQLAIIDRAGNAYNLDLSSAETVTDLIEAIETGTSGNVVASLNSTGNGLMLTDRTGGSASNLVIGGAAANELGIATGGSGVAADFYEGSTSDLAYVGAATLLTDLAGGDAIGSGEIRITDSNGLSRTIDIGSSQETVGELIRRLNRDLDGTSVSARLNDAGDGLLLEDTGTGSLAMKVEDVEGNVGSVLGLTGEATGTGASNFINASLEKTIDVETTDTLTEIAQKINDADPSVAATVLSDGSSVNPFRLNLTSDNSGVDGRFIIDTGGFDLGIQTLDEGQNSRVLYGSGDAANALLITSSTNQVDGVIQGVSIDLLGTSDDPIQLSVAEDTATLEADVQSFVDAFNAAIDAIDAQTRFDTETESGGPLVGDSTARSLRTRMFDTIFGVGENISGSFSRLVEIGITIGSEGDLEFDSDEFREALAADPEGVESLLTARELAPVEEFTEISPGISVRNTNTDDTFTSLGIASLIEELMDDYINSVDGILTRRNDTLQEQIDDQNEAIEAFDERLERQREILTLEFLAMEQAIASLQNQQSSLGQIAAI